MNADKIMTPSEVQIAASDTNNEIRATEIQLRKLVKDWFLVAKPSVFKQINNELITQTAANDNPIILRTFVKDYGYKIYNKPPVNKIGVVAAQKIIENESETQCKLIGDFIKAQGHNLVNTTTQLNYEFGIVDIECLFSFVPNQK